MYINIIPTTIEKKGKKHFQPRHFQLCWVAKLIQIQDAGIYQTQHIYWLEAQNQRRIDHFIQMI